MILGDEIRLYIYIYITYQYTMYISRNLDYWEGEGGQDTDRSEFLQGVIQGLLTSPTSGQAEPSIV